MDNPNPIQRQYETICLRLKEAIECIGTFQRRFHPADTAGLDEILLPHKAYLKEAIREIWEMIVPDEMEDVVAILDESTSVVLDVLETILAVLGTKSQDGVTQIGRSGRRIFRVQDQLYPIRMTSPHLDRLFLEPDAPPPVETPESATARNVLVGLNHVTMEEGDDYARGGFSFYVPESYDESIEWPLVIGLHGGSGHGRDFIWTWLREARSRRFILLSPTSVDRTWSLMDPQVDGNRLLSFLSFMGERYNLDMNRVLLTGMSDGATFALIFSLQEQTPFTAFAPIAGVLQPYDLKSAAGRRVYWIHGALDWMFPIYRARDGSRALRKAGAEIRFREIDDLSHTYPREENDQVLKWFDPGLALSPEL